jgi:hypothetical protein
MRAFLETTQIEAMRLCRGQKLGAALNIRTVSGTGYALDPPRKRKT